MARFRLGFGWEVIPDTPTLASGGDASIGVRRRRMCIGQAKE